MTDREKAIVMAYTGVCMLTDDKFQIFHEYVEEIMGRPVYTHEMAAKEIETEIKEKAKADFMTLCAEQEPEIGYSVTLQPCEDAISRKAAIDAMCDKCPVYECTHECNAYYALKHLAPVTPQEREPKTGYWIRVTDKTGHLVWECDKCSWQQRFNTNFCPDCGAKMESEV